MKENSFLTRGAHLRIMREWIQRRAINGERVTWESEELLILKSVTVRDMEILAQRIRNAVQYENEKGNKGKKNETI